ncbi:MAG: serine hydrolase domain-containing protein [Acidimicrobiales bacterium]
MGEFVGRHPEHEAWNQTDPRGRRRARRGRYRPRGPAPPPARPHRDAGLTGEEKEHGSDPHRPRRHRRARKSSRREIDDGLLPSCQLALALDGEVVEQVTLGDHLGDDSRYATFSAIKGVVYTATWQLLAEGTLRLDQPVADVIPEFGANGKEAVTVEQLMCHRSGFPLARLGPPDWADRAKRLEAFAHWKLTTEPGTYAYHITSAHWVLAELIERIDGIDYRQALRRRLFDPLGLKRLELGVPIERTGDINLARLVGEPATAEEFEAAIGVPGIKPDNFNDDTAIASAQPEHLAVGMPGGGGVSTAGDLARLLPGATAQPRRALGPALARRRHRRRAGHRLGHALRGARQPRHRHGRRW